MKEKTPRSRKSTQPRTGAIKPRKVTRGTRSSANAWLVPFYVSRDRVFSLLGAHVPFTNSQEGPSHTASLSRALSSYLETAIGSGSIKTLQELAAENALRTGAQFIYDGHFYGKGFGFANKTLALSLHEKLDDLMGGRTLLFEFSKNGLLNTTAYTRMSGSTRLFAFGYIADVDEKTIRAVPYAIGDLVDQASPLRLPFAPTLELQPDSIRQFSGMDSSWIPSKKEFAQLAEIPESAIKELIGRLLGEIKVPSDWGGEESDLFSANLVVDGKRKTGAFLLKGPAAFHPMTPRDLGKNGDQIYRLFNIPADVYIVQHCHTIGAAVRKTLEAYALTRSFTALCNYVVMDGFATARLLRAHGRWKTPPARRRRIVGK